MEQIAWTSERILEQTMQRIAPLPSQAGYAKALASIFSVHIHRNELIDDGYSPDDIPASSAIVVAPTGQGKTYLLRKMAECLDLNVITVDCSTLVAEGWKGVSLSQRLSASKSEAKNERSFSRSILFLDEVDKLCNNPHPANTMSTLLQLFNNGCVAIDDRNTEHIDISRFTILLGGAFVGLDDIIQERVCPKPKIGFGSSTTTENLSTAELMQQATADDLVKFGLMPELVGRIGTVLSIPPLEKEDYRQLLNAEAGSLYRRYNNYLMNIHGVRFEIAPAGVETIAQECIKSATGARAVNPLVNDMMRGALSDVESQSTICKVILDADEDGCCIMYEHGSRSYAYRDPQRAQNAELPWHTVKASSPASVTRKLCRYYRNAGGDLKLLPLLEAFLLCTNNYLHQKTRPNEFTFDSLEKLARATNRENSKSPYDIIMEDVRFHLTPEYKEFNKMYNSWTMQNLISALQVIMNYIQTMHGPCRMRFEVPRKKVLIQTERKRIDWGTQK